MLTDGIEQILFFAPRAARCLHCHCLWSAPTPCPGPPGTVPPPQPYLAISPGLGAAPASHEEHPALHGPAGLGIFGVLFPFWHRCRGCAALPEQLPHEGGRPQTVNCSAARSHTRAGATAALHVYGRALPHRPVPACPAPSRRAEEHAGDGLLLLQRVRVCQQ